jgi:hypothetical protein
MSEEKDTLILNDPETVSIETYSLPQIDLGSLTNSMYYSTNPTGCLTSWTTSSPNYGNVTINTGAGSNGTWGNSAPYIYTTNGTGLHVSTDAEFEGDIKWKGRSLGKLLEKIEDRLAILTPDSKKLEHFAALKKAYDHYKALEALCELPKEEDDNT